MKETDNVIDLTEIRLRRQAETTPCALTAELSWALLDLYRSGAIDVAFDGGEPLYSLRPGYEEALYAAREGPSADP